MNVVDQQTFCDTMPCVGVAVNIITMDGPAGHVGFTASVVCNVTDTPPTLLVCPNRGAPIWLVLNENRTLCASILSAGQESLSDLSGGKTPMEHCFVVARWQTGVVGCSQLEEALISFDCCISQVASVGTHDTLFCIIETVHYHATPYGLVWFDRSYHALMRPAC